MIPELALGELTVHGNDIATGTGRPWPTSAAPAKLILGTVCPNMSPLVVRPEACRGASVTHAVRLRGNGPRWVIEVADGNAEVRAAVRGSACDSRCCSSTRESLPSTGGGTEETSTSPVLAITP